MKRSDKVYAYVVEKTNHLTTADLDNNQGVTTLDVVNALNIQRPNASRDLNELVREGLVIKSKSRPVQYIANLDATQTTSKVAKASTNKFIEPVAFQNLVGVNQSLKMPVDQAKAAVLYPPKGLNCLITGATGSGKSFFVNAMFEFAKKQGVIAPDKKLILFNCADYAHNSELLMSHLFGYVEGAFTGANKTKEGLIYEANNSMLFLDEVHRLPPEGQEMIFYFMDHGSYNRLGETLKSQTANVRIVCATTEDPSSTLLDTFIRRIPINIQLPNFSARTTREKIDLTTRMLAIEAERIQKNVVVSSDVIKALIGSVRFGNVGQLKSNVQLVCAHAFLNNMGDPDLKINFNQLPNEIKRGLTDISANRKLSSELSQLLKPSDTISPHSTTKSYFTDAYELPYDLYDVISQKSNYLKGLGSSQEEINQTIMEEINQHLQSFYQDHGLTFNMENKLAELVDPELVELTKEIHKIACHKLEYPFQINFIYALSLHISAFLKRIDQNPKETGIKANENIRELVVKHPKEYQLALTIKTLIVNKYQVELPEEEINYLALLIISLKENEHTGQIGVIVAAHGDSTASSMTAVAKQLFNNENIAAMDMPLDMSPQVAFENVVEVAHSINYTDGILFLVDMGSLLTFEDELEKRLGVHVRMIDMVTTSLVLEAARKTDLIDTDLDNVYDSLKNFHGYSQTRSETQIIANFTNSLDLESEVDDIDQLLNSPVKEKKAIVAICASGKGAAERMKSIIKEQLGDLYPSQLYILPISVLEMQETLKKIQKEYDLIAITGIVDPKIGVPYFSMESLFSGKAVHGLYELIVEHQLNIPEVSIDESQAQKLCHEYVEAYFTFVNPSKVVEPFWNFIQVVLSKTKKMEGQDYSAYINITMHLAGAMERVLRQDPLTATAEQICSEEKDTLYQKIKEEIQELETIFNLEFPSGEIFYIFQNFKNTLGNL